MAPRNFQLEYAIDGCTAGEIHDILEQQDDLQEFTISTRENKLVFDLPPNGDIHGSMSKIHSIINRCLQSKVSEVKPNVL